MFRMLKQMSILSGFVRWLIPEQGRSMRFYFSLINVLIGSRQSVYRHFREIKASDRRSRFKDFLRALAAVSDKGQTSVPAALLARLLRTIYLTEVLPRKDDDSRYGGPNQGYINHPQFSYGNSLQSIASPKNEDC